MSNTIKTAIESFASDIRDMIEAEHKRAGYSHVPTPTMEISWGRKYARIIRCDTDHSRSAHCFVDMTTGDILKTASWKKPAKGVRGNVLRDDRMSSVTRSGAVYNR